MFMELEKIKYFYSHHHKTCFKQPNPIMFVSTSC